MKIGNCSIELLEDSFFYLKLNQESLTIPNGKSFLALMEEKLSSKNFILDCEDVSFFPTEWTRLFVSLQNILKKNEKKLQIINVGISLTKEMKSSGVFDSFSVSKNLKEAKEKIGIQNKRKLDVNFIEPFIQATMNVLKIQAQVESMAGKMQIKKDNDHLTGDVSGVIGIVSDSFNGSVVITFPEKTFLRTMSNMLGEDFLKMEKDLLDGASEITNMIFGQAKIVLNEKGYGIKMALPSVIHGKNHSHVSTSKGDTIVVPFSSNIGDFFIEISLA